MDIIVKHFSKGVIAAMGLLFLLTILFHVSFPKDKTGYISYLGEGWMDKSVDVKKDMGFEKFQEQGNLRVPMIEFQVNKPLLVTQQSMDIKQYFVAYDYKNENLPFTVVAIYNMQKERQDDIYDEQKQTMYFKKAGIYQIQLKTKDSTNKTYIYQFAIPVERK